MDLNSMEAFDEVVHEWAIGPAFDNSPSGWIVVHKKATPAC